MNIKIVLAAMSASAFLGCGEAGMEDLLARYRAEGSLVPIDTTGNTLRFTSNEKYEMFSKTLAEWGIAQERKTATQKISVSDSTEEQGITGTNRFGGCRGEISRDTYSAFPGWIFFRAKTVVENVYKRGDGWGAGVAARVALPSGGGMFSDGFKSVDSLADGTGGYQPLVQDYSSVIVSMDGKEKRARHSCGWGSYDLECKYWICVDHERRWNEDWTGEVESEVLP